MRKVNFHTHTDRCGHAIGTAEEYVLSAIDAGFQILGFADHTPWPYHSAYHSRMRMPLQDLEPYIREIRSLQALYREKISVRLGLECECFPRYLPWLQEMVQEWKLDYLILGSHFYPTDEYGPYFGQCVTNIRMLNLYVNATLEGMQSGLFAYLAHPDLFLRPYPEFDDACLQASQVLCRAAKELHMPLEYNLAGLRFDEETHSEGYPCFPFWQVAAEEGCQVILGMDAHDPDHLRDPYYYEKGLHTLRELGMSIVDGISYFPWAEPDPVIQSEDPSSPLGSEAL